MQATPARQHFTGPSPDLTLHRHFRFAGWAREGIRTCLTFSKMGSAHNAAVLTLP